MWGAGMFQVIKTTIFSIILSSVAASAIARDDVGADAAVTGQEQRVAVSSKSASKAPAGRASCLDHAKAAEERHGLPDGLLQSVVIVESGANPFAVNFKGKGYMYKDLETAHGFVSELLSEGRKVIDVGCGQVNLYWHPKAFADLDEAFDPASNLDYAARHLRELAGPSENWERAVGHYHSPSNPERAEHYRKAVYAVYAKRGEGFAQIRKKSMPANNPKGASLDATIETEAFDYDEVGIYEVVSRKPDLPASASGISPEPSATSSQAPVSALPGAISIKKW